MRKIKSYLCNSGTGITAVINATTIGKAKARFREEYDVCFTKVNAKTVPLVTPPNFFHIAKMRGVPNAFIGQLVTVDGQLGRILEHNESANFNIEFEDGSVGNCHPNWKMAFLDEEVV